jgi:hypothetical protein
VGEVQFRKLVPDALENRLRVQPVIVGVVVVLHADMYLPRSHYECGPPAIPYFHSDIHADSQISGLHTYAHT